MVRSASLASLALLSLAPPAPARAADVPPEPGVYWEQQVEMQMTGFSMPAQKQKVCLPKKGVEEPPASRDDQKCKVKDVKRTGERMTWKMECQDGTSGEGDITWGKEAYEGAMTMRTQGQEMRMKMKGKKVGGDCDANELKRKVAGMQKQAADAQDQNAKSVAEQCAASADKMELRMFVPYQKGMQVYCTDSTRFCANLETRKGLLAFRGYSDPQNDPRKQAEKLCKKDLAAVEKKHCSEAAKAQEKKTRFDDPETLEFVFAFCPDLAQSLAKRECKGRSYTSLPKAQRDFCTRWAEKALAGGAEEAEPVPAKSGGKYMKSGIPDVDEPAKPAKKTEKKKAAAEDEDEAPAKQPEDMKSKIMKGIFGR